MVEGHYRLTGDQTVLQQVDRKLAYVHAVPVGGSRTAYYAIGITHEEVAVLNGFGLNMRQVERSRPIDVRNVNAILGAQ